MPEQGLHMVARLTDGRSDVEIAAAATKAGIGARALSPMFVDRPPEQGLVLGFSSFTPEEIRTAAIRLCGFL
ncbi:MAG: hypothetical protein J0H61_11445 [Alphaproteobacteria bacterium]|nr:hypothetical protein [Alphaproteobacteria bacterium]